MQRRALLRLALPICASSLALTGCALPPRIAPAQPAQSWRGRMALQLHDAQQQSFSAAFELQGSESAGLLTLLSPFGAVLATVQWSPEGAQLRQGSELRESPSLDALLQESLGTALPLAALFSWLAGENAQADGWQADLTQIAQGRLRATRTHPLPSATLRLVLDR